MSTNTFFMASLAEMFAQGEQSNLSKYFNPFYPDILEILIEYCSWMDVVWSMRNSALTGAPSPSCAQVSLLCALVHPSKQTDDQPDSSLDRYVGMKVDR